MQVGGGGSLRSDINVTPLVDVVLVLLIIFMVITPVVQMGYLVKVPPKAPQNIPPSAVQDQIILRLQPDKSVLINKDTVPLDQFPQRMREILHGNTSRMVFFQGSPDVDYETTMSFLDLARASGAKNIGIIVEAAQESAFRVFPGRTGTLACPLFFPAGVGSTEFDHGSHPCGRRSDSSIATSAECGHQGSGRQPWM